MKKINLMSIRPSFRSSVILLFLDVNNKPTGCQKIIDEFHHKHDKTPELPGNFVQTNLVANKAGYDAKRLDPLLINGWGIAFSAGGTAWLGSRGPC